MSWTDKELDELFKGASAEQSFEYRSEYFKDIEVQLPVRKKRRGILWWGSAFGSLIMVLSIGMLQQRTEAVSSGEQKLSAEQKVVSSGVLAKKKTGVEQDRVARQAALPVNNPVSPVAYPEKVQEAGLTDRNEPLMKLNPDVIAVSEELVVATEPKIEEPADNSIGSLDVKGLESTPQPELIQRTFAIRTSKKPGLSIFAEAGAGVGQSPVRDTELGSSFCASYGVNTGLEYRRKNLTVSAGIGVKRQHFDNVYIVERSMIYGFGVNTYDNQYHFNSLYSLTLPVRIGFTSQKHSIEAGLITSLPMLATVRFHEQLDGVTQRKGSGFTSTDMFRSVNLAPELSYSFRLNNAWSFGAAASIQLGSGMTSDRIKGAQNQLPLSATFSIKRNFDLRLK